MATAQKSRKAKKATKAAGSAKKAVKTAKPKARATTKASSNGRNGKKAAKPAARSASVSRAKAKTSASKSPARKATASKPVSTPRARVKETPVKKGKKLDLRAVKKDLQARRALLLGQIRRHTQGGVDAGEKPVGDRADDASFDLELDSSYSLAEREAQELRYIESALEKVAGGTYGTCEECGGEIESPRLEALPYAVLCLKCKESEELTQKPEASEIAYGKIEEE